MNTRLDIRGALELEAPYELILRATLLVVLLYGATTPFVDVPMRLLCGLALLLPALLVHRAVWWALALALVLGNAVDWYYIDNHKYLIAYWVVGCAVSLHLADTEKPKYMRTTARLLIGIVFGFAAAWKILGGEYLNGDFLYFTFLMDQRLQFPASLISGHSIDALTMSRDAASYLGTMAVPGSEIPVLESRILRSVTIVLSWLTIAGEGAVATLHLWTPQHTYRLRQHLLMLFIVLTYFLLPVIGFAAILTLLGLAQCDDDDGEMRFEYLLLFGVIHLTLVPWQSVVGRLF